MNILTELRDLHQKYWRKRGKRGMFASERFARFHELIISRLFDRGNFVLYRVRSKMYGTVGCLYLTVCHGYARGYQSGFNYFDDVAFTSINKKRLKPGFITHVMCMEECLKRGLKSYNFAASGDSYKHELANSVSYLSTVSVRRKRLKPWLRDVCISAYNLLDSKQLSSWVGGKLTIVRVLNK